MPQFQLGEAKTARITMRNPTGSALNYRTALYMGVDQVVMAEANFTLAAGESRDISLPATMPVQIGQYPVYISVFSANTLIAHYRATEDVTVVTVTGMPSDALLDAVKAWTKSQLDALPWDPCADIHCTPEMSAKLSQVIETISALRQAVYDEAQRLFDNCMAQKQPEIDSLNQQMKDLEQLTGSVWCGAEPYQIMRNLGVSDLTIGPEGQVYSTAFCPPGYTGGVNMPECMLGYIQDIVPSGRLAWNAAGAQWAYGKINCVGVYYARASLTEQMRAIQEQCRETSNFWANIRKGDELFLGVWYCKFPLGY